ncbi:MAG: type IV pilus biogenesis/stability protein PilW [Pseudomonadota bacterium]
MSRTTLLLLPLLLLAACVTSTTSDRTVDKKGAAKANVDLGVAYMQQGNLQTAKDKLERAEKQDPKNPEVYWVKASLYERMNMPRDADRSYQRAMELAPANSNIVNTYAVFLCRQGEIDRALPMFDKVIADKLYQTPYAAAANAGMCLRDQKRGADAKRYFESAVQMGPGFTDGVIGLGDLQINQGDPAGAMHTVDTFLRTGTRSADVLVMGVRAAVAQRDCNAAQRYAVLLRAQFQNAAQTTSLPQLMGSCSSLSR